jgi:hypothetical protein
VIKELNNLYSSADTIRVIKDTWGDEKWYKILESLKGRDHSEELDVDGRIILSWILRK